MHPSVGGRIVAHAVRIIVKPGNGAVQYIRPAIERDLPTKDLLRGMSSRILRCLGTSLLLTLISEVSVNGDEAVALVKRAAAAYQQNKAAIKTWRGSVRVEDQKYEEGKLVHRDESKIDFAYDANRNVLRWNRTKLKSVDVIDGNEIDVFTSYLEMSGLRKENEYWEVIKRHDPRG